MKFLQLSDIHLESPFAALPPQKGALRRSEMRETFARALALGKAQGAQIALLAGDLFENNFVPESAARAVIESMRAAAPMRIFLSPGNHDFLESKSPYQR